MDWKVIDLSHSLPLSLSLFCSLSLTINLPTYRSIYLFIYLSTYLSISFSSYQTSYLSLYLSSVSTISCIYLIYLSIYPSIHLSIYLSICHAKRHLNFQKRSERGLFCTFWLRKCASHHNGVHFFDITTSKSGPNVVCFVHFDFENVLRATTACAFLTSQLSKLVRAWCALCILTWKRASRHNAVQFAISHLPGWLRTRRFSEPTFRPSGATNHCKNTVFHDFPAFLRSDTFSRTWIFFLLTLSLLWSSLFFSSLLWLFPPLLFHLSILPGSLASKLPSTITTTNTNHSKLRYTRLHYTTL